ncbi:MAG TPA: glycoside hydrolase family 2 TIM barrel-domain containing protein [Sphingobacteriaceae bacterium]|nr:glycoside hydrolase family 2 TIM barrel-domain containing protein [Sphingobacteriaceae bacterium]
MKKSFSIGILLFLSLALSAQENTVNPGNMKTEWGAKVTPENAWRQYPRPQMVRSEWKNMNGLWDYSIKPKNDAEPENYDGKILVPFGAESTLSGVGKMVRPDQRLWYKTTFQVPAGWKNKSLLLHFDAVDWESTIYINDKKVGTHKGGSDPFTFDISKYIQKGQQELVVSVWDPTDTESQARGKQVLAPRGIWYTPVTGIWQTVWLEPVEKTHIISVLPEADIDNNKVVLRSLINGATGKERLTVKVLKNDKVIAEKTGFANTALEINIPEPDLWTPYNPKLYKLDVKLTNGSRTLDKVSSYFAMRKISTGKDESGYERLLLNNQPIFQYGTLDQGWWPDGLLTPPSEEAMRFDMDVLKDMGFNMLRKHIKVEPSRYYYYADSIGLLVWQDMVSGFKTSEASIQHVKAEAKEDWARPKESAIQYEQEWKSIIDHLRFFPSIVVWVPFNEGWGQYDTKRVVEWTQKYDPSRVVNGVSGWTDRNVGAMNDAHQYPGPAMEPAEQNPGRVIVLGEFGGLGLPLEGHLWNQKMRNWGYRTYLAKDTLIKEYSTLMHNLYPMKNRGLSAAVYTQTTDVEGEVNGLITYDRKVIKFNPALMRILHYPLYKDPVKSEAIFIDSEVTPQQIRITNNKSAAFSSVSAPVMLKKGDMRRASKIFNFDKIPKNIQLRLLVHADAKVYLNGRLVVNKFINTKRHYDEINLSEFSGYLNKGENNLLVEINDVKSDSAFDFGLYSF